MEKSLNNLSKKELIELLLMEQKEVHRSQNLIQEKNIVIVQKENVIKNKENVIVEKNIIIEKTEDLIEQKNGVNFSITAHAFWCKE